jgi:hypothetical protein
MQLHRKLQPKTIFLIDGIGALVSAILLGLVLTRLEAFFGLPKNVLYVLSGIAVLLAVYSLAHAFMRTFDTSVRLKLIAVANLFYCVLTVVLLIAFYQQMTVYDLLYFVGELLIILSLAYFELKAAAVSRKKK